MQQEKLKLITAPSSETGETEFWVSDVEQLWEDDDEWGFRLYASNTRHLATFVYSGREAAEAAYQMLPALLIDCTSLETGAHARRSGGEPG